MLESCRNISFRLFGKRGAAIVTKHQTLREDIQRAGTFEKYIKEHYDSWVEFASVTASEDVARTCFPGFLGLLNLIRRFF